MKVKELIDILNDLDPEADVVLAKDPEGNGFEVCSAFWATVWSPEDKEPHNDEDGDEPPEDAVNIVVLWP